MNASEEFIDMDVIKSLDDLHVEGDTDFVSELVDLFLADAPGCVERIQRAHSRGSIQELETAAHNLKGSASNLGAVRLSRAAKKIMDIAARGNLPSQAQVDAVAKELELVRPFLLRLKER